MKKFITIFLGTLGVFFLLFMAYMIFIVKAGPVDISKDNSVEVSGIVTSIYEGGVKDLVFKLDSEGSVYYINRGLENGFDLKAIENELLGKEVTLLYAKHRSIGSSHMTQLKFKDSIYYSEWDLPLANK